MIILGLLFIVVALPVQPVHFQQPVQQVIQSRDDERAMKTISLYLSFQWLTRNIQRETTPAKKMPPDDGFAMDTRAFLENEALRINLCILSL